MRSHIAAQHAIAYDKYVQQYGSSEVVSKKFRCELCNSVFKHCRQNIYTHMKDVHKISLQEYEARVGIPEEGAPAAEEEAMPEDIYLQELGATADPRPSSSSSAVAAVAADDDGSADEQAMLAGGHTPSRWNRCRFCCR